MSVLIRFKTGRDDKYHKARIFERGSRKIICSCCKERKYGILVRLSDPVKTDRLICLECIVRIVIGEQIKVADKPGCLFGIYSKPKRRGRKPGPNAKPGRKPKKPTVDRVLPVCNKCGKYHWQMQPCDMGVEQSTEIPVNESETAAVGQTPESGLDGINTEGIVTDEAPVGPEPDVAEQTTINEDGSASVDLTILDETPDKPDEEAVKKAAERVDSLIDNQIEKPISE